MKGETLGPPRKCSQSPWGREVPRTCPWSWVSCLDLLETVRFLTPSCKRGANSKKDIPIFSNLYTSPCMRGLGFPPGFHWGSQKTGSLFLRTWTPRSQIRVWEGGPFSSPRSRMHQGPSLEGFSYFRPASITPALDVCLAGFRGFLQTTGEFWASFSCWRMYPAMSQRPTLDPGSMRSLAPSSSMMRPRRSSGSLGSHREGKPAVGEGEEVAEQTFSFCPPKIGCGPPGNARAASACKH